MLKKTNEVFKLDGILELVEKIKEDIVQTVGQERLYVSFSGGLDSTVVALLAKDALGSDRVTLLNVCFGPYSFSKGIQAVLSLSAQMGLRLFFIPGEDEQTALMYHGPNCNSCTKNIKMGQVRKFVYKGIIASGANLSDSWGKTGIKFMDGFYSPLIGLEKVEIRKILEYYGVTIPKIGENYNREGCKLKHLLKMNVSKDFHARAVCFSNEVIHDILDQFEYERSIANVKIIGPLSKNIALVNIKPFPDKAIQDEIFSVLSAESSINEVWFADKPIELEIRANPGIYNNMDSKYWVLNGRLAPEFSCPVTAVWKKSRNNKLHTFAVTGFRYI